MGPISVHFRGPWPIQGPQEGYEAIFWPNFGILNYCVTQLKLYTVYKLSSAIFCCLYVCQASITPDQISTFSIIYRHTSPFLTLYHLTPSSTNLYWPSTSQYRLILIQYHQVPLLIHHLDRHSSANWIISLFTTHLMSHAQYTWSSLLLQLMWKTPHFMEKGF